MEGNWYNQYKHMHMICMYMYIDIYIYMYTYICIYIYIDVNLFSWIVFFVRQSPKKASGFHVQNLFFASLLSHGGHSRPFSQLLQGSGSCGHTRWTRCTTCIPRVESMTAKRAHCHMKWPSLGRLGDFDYIITTSIQLSSPSKWSLRRPPLPQKASLAQGFRKLSIKMTST